MRLLKSPYLSENQRIIPRDFNALGRAVLSAVTNVVGHLLIDPAHASNGLVAWGLRVSPVGDASPMTIRVDVGAGVCSGSATNSDEGLSLVELLTGDGRTYTLESGVDPREYRVYLVGAVQTGDAEQREFRVSTAAGDTVEARPTPTSTRIAPTVQAVYGGALAPANGILLATIDVAGGAESVAVEDITDARTMLYSTTGSAGGALRGLRTLTAWAVNSINTFASTMNLVVLPRINAAINESGNRLRHGHLDDTDDAAEAATDGLALTTATVSRARCIVSPVYELVDYSDGLVHYNFARATWAGQNVKSVTRVTLGTYDVELADALVEALDGKPQITNRVRWSAVATLNLLDPDTLADLDEAHFPGEPFTRGAIRLRVLAVSTATFRVAAYMWRPADEDYMLTDVPFTLDVQGPMPGDEAAVAD